MKRRITASQKPTFTYSSHRRWSLEWMQGFLDSGVDVVDIGSITTDMLYYAVGASDYSGGIVVSASHNPKEYNGMKMVREKATAISSDTGLFDIRDALKDGKDAEITADRKGTCTDRDILNDYL